MICPNITIKEVKDSFNEMVEALGGRPLTDEEFKSSELRNQRTGLDYSAMNAAYRSYHRNNGNMLDKAPNGNDSVLFNSLLEYFDGDRAKAIKAKSNVYTDQFFNWFGDWIILATPDLKDEDIKSGDISKAVDENGEPLVVWHGSKMENLDKFDLNKASDKKTIYFTSEKDVAYSYIDWLDVGFFRKMSNDEVNTVYKNYDDYVSKNSQLYSDDDPFPVPLLSEEQFNVIQYYKAKFKSHIVAGYINIKHPYVLDAKGQKWSRMYVDGEITNTARISKKTRDLKHDGAIIKNIIDNGLKNQYDIVSGYKKSDEFLVFHPNQIKHVKNLGDWSTEDNNIYHNLPIQENASLTVRTNLKQRGLIHSFLGDRVNKNILNSRQLIEEACARTGVYPIFTKGPNSTLVEFIDNCYIAQDLKDELERTNDKSIDNILSIARTLQQKVPQMRFEVIKPSDIPEGVKKNANSYVKGNIVYLIAGRATTESTVEEFMHPFVYTIQNSNFSLFQDLFEEAKKDFPKLWAEIQDTYTDKQGFEYSNRQNELVTQALSRYVHTGYKKAQNRNLVKDLVQKALRYISKLLQAAIERVGNDYMVDPEKLPRMTLNELSQLVVADDTKLRVFTTEQTQYSISATAKTEQEIAKDITQRFNVLYRAYEKMPNKSPRRQQIQNRIFELYNELQQHQDISAVRIALDFGLQNVGTIDNTTGAPSNVNSVLGYLYKEEQNPDKYSGVTPKNLVDMYQNSIGFYDNLLNNYIPNNLNKLLTADDRAKITQLRESIDLAKSMWTQAMVVVGDKIVDEQINNEVDADDIDKENMKTVAKDFLHKNVMYGDLNAFESYVFNNGFSSNPIIKQAFHLIQHVETKTLEEIHPIAQRVAKAYRKADKLYKKIGANWQTILMEYDADGIPTGNFVRNINYGQYEKDLEEFIQKLNEEFESKYGHTYIDDGNGVVINSATQDLAENEEWVNGKEPTYVTYLKRIEQFKCERANRRYTIDYYNERLSQPYKGSLDPNEVDVNKFGHGLSPKALSRYNHIQSNINYYLDKCTDPTTGLAYPERLDDQDKLSLDAWQDSLERLSSPFNDDMSPKQDDELQIAFEIRAWQKWLGEQLTSVVDIDSYVDELNRLTTEATQNNNWGPVHSFVKYNSQIGINPDFIEQTIGQFAKSNPNDQEVIHAQFLKQALQSMVKTKNGYTRDLQKMENKPEFWLNCKHMDQIIEDGKTPSNDPDFAKALEDNFSFDEILYRDAYGRAIDAQGNPVNPQDEDLHNDLLTYRRYLINKYTNIAINSPNGTILGLNNHNGNPIVFTGTPDEIKETITKLFSYRKQRVSSDGTVTIEYVPLTVFSMMTPKHDSFMNNRTGRSELTILQVPRGRFAEKQDKHGKYMNRDYNHNDLNSEQPRLDYFDANGNARYDNSQAFSKVMKDPATAELYDVLIDVMQDAQNNYSTQNRRFNYRLPQINADGMQLMSRLMKEGFKNTAVSMWEALTTVEENDESMRTADDYITNPDGSIATDVPLKYVRKLKDPSRLTTDVVGSVILFANMALNYKNKCEIDAQLKTLRYNLDPNIRRDVELATGEFSPQDDRNALSTFDSMLNKHMYNNQWATHPQEGPSSRAIVAWNKAMRKVHRLETTQMLALNLFSMLVGFGDSTTRILKESIMGKYMTIQDSFVSLMRCLKYTPAVIANIGNPVANNKLTRAMQINGISKGVHQTYEHTNYGRGRKVLNNLLMGGFSMLDWMANSLLLSSFYNNVRFYDGGIVDTGFYSLYELEQAFVNAGHSKKEAILAHIMCNKTLWGAYDENMQVKPQYEKYVTQKIKTRIRTKTLQRSALYNGMNPDNDTPRYKQSIVGNFIGAMRGWLTMAIQHLFAGGQDNVVRDIKSIQEYKIKNSKTFRMRTSKKEALTDEQRTRRMSWNYETGTPDDQIYVALWRSFNTLGRKLWRYATLNFADAKKAKFSYIERYAWRDAIVYLGVLGLCMIGWPMLNEQASTVEAPKTRQQAGPTDITDVPRWFDQQYIGEQYWKLQASDIGFRVIEAQITSIDPTSATDVVNSITTLQSGVNEHLGLVKATGDVLGLSGHSTDEQVKQGGYKYYTRGERNWYKFLGPVDNLQTAFTYYGITTNQQFYTNTYGGIYRWFGYDFKHEKNKKKSGPTFAKPNSSGPSFKGPKF